MSDTIIEYSPRAKCTIFSKGFIQEVRDEIVDPEEPEICNNE